jgi:hypothetical protein
VRSGADIERGDGASATSSAGRGGRRHRGGGAARALIGDMAREPWQLVSAVLLVLVLVAAVALVAARFCSRSGADRDVDRARPRRCPP